MIPISVVILTKNEERNIARTITPLLKLTDDIIIMDSGSTDNTASIAKNLGVTVVETKWYGYGATKNKGNDIAKYNWILSIDADEEINNTLLKSILAINWQEEQTIYLVKRVTYYCGKIIKHGTFKNEWIPRLFHKRFSKWNDAHVHESLLSENGNYKKLKGELIHYTIQSLQEHDNKIEYYSQLAAQEMYAKNKKVSWLKVYGSTAIKFLKDYYFNAGFLEGKMGFIIAKKSAYATFIKYKKLKQLHAKHFNK